MFGNQGQTEPRAIGGAAPARGDPSVEAFEDPVTIVGFDARSGVVHGDLETVVVCRDGYRHISRPPCVEAGVLEQVRNDSLYSPFVHQEHGSVGPCRDLYGGLLGGGKALAGSTHALPDELACDHLVKQEIT